MTTVKGFALVCVVCGVACDATRICAQCAADGERDIIDALSGKYKGYSAAECAEMVEDYRKMLAAMVPGKWCDHCACVLLANERELCTGCAETAHYWSEMDEQLSFDF